MPSTELRDYRLAGLKAAQQVFASTRERANRMVGLLADYQYGSLDYFAEHGVEVIERDVGSASTGQGNDRHGPDDPSDQHSGL